MAEQERARSPEDSDSGGGAPTALSELQRTWDRLGRVDPYWAICSDPSKQGGRWDLPEFFRSGRQEIAEVMALADLVGLPRDRGRALDFGCGAGRLTQALCDFFGQCVGVDIAPSMIELARTHNRFGARCQYVLNETTALGFLPDESCDFIYTNNVLQHMNPALARGYLGEFLRVLRPEGLLIFHVPMKPRESRVAEPLPERAFRARVEVLDAPGAWRTSTTVPLRLRIRNESPVPWPQLGGGTSPRVIAAGNHWFDRSGRAVLFDDGRAPLPGPVAPGEEVEVDLVVWTPPRPGAYVLELDLVQEEVAWFADRGSPSLRLPVSLEGEEVREFAAAVPETTGGAPGRPAMEMHLYEPLEVHSFLREAGAAVVFDEPPHVGSEWLYSRYSVTKPPRGRTGARAAASEVRAAGRELERLLAVGTRRGRPRGRAAALDLGCGDGLRVAALAERFDEAWGIEAPPRSLRAARERSGPDRRTRFTLTRECDLLFLEDGRFDLVLASLPARFPRDVATRLTAAAARVLAPGGLLVLDLPSAGSPATGDGLTLRPVPVDEARSLIASLGLLFLELEEEQRPDGTCVRYHVARPESPVARRRAE